MIQVRAGWVLLGLAAVAALAWWAARDEDAAERGRARDARARQAAADIAEDARPALYRWRDADGVLHVADQPPEQGAYERIAIDAPPQAEVRGDRD